MRRLQEIVPQVVKQLQQLSYNPNLKSVISSAKDQTRINQSKHLTHITKKTTKKLIFELKESLSHESDFEFITPQKFVGGVTRMIYFADDERKKSLSKNKREKKVTFVRVTRKITHKKNHFSK